MKKLVLLLCAFAAVLPAFSNQGVIQGNVEDSNILQPIEGVEVKLFKNTIFLGSDITDQYGNFSFSGLSQNLYELQFLHEDYFEDNTFVLVPDSTTIYVNKQLNPKIVEVSVAEIVINGDSILGITYQVNLGDTLDCEFYIQNDGNVPVNSYMTVSSTAIGFDPDSVVTEECNIDPGQTGLLTFTLIINDGYLNGEKEIQYHLRAWDPDRIPDYINYPQSAFQSLGNFLVSSDFKNAIFSRLDFDKLIYEPGEELNIALKLKNNGEIGAAFSVTVCISDIPHNSGEIDTINYEHHQNNIVLNKDEEKTLNRVNWQIPQDFDGKECYVFATVTSVTGDVTIEYDKTIGVFHVENIPQVISYTAEHYRPVNGIAEIVPVDIEGQDMYVITYYDVNSEILYFDGQQYWSGGYEDIEYMIVTDEQGLAIRQVSDLFRKSLFTAMGYEVFEKADVYWVENMKKLYKLYKDVDSLKNVHQDFINGNIANAEHRILIAKIGQLFAGIGSSVVTGPALAGGTIADIIFKDQMIITVLPFVAGELASYAGSTSDFGTIIPQHPENNPIPYSEPQEIQENTDFLLTAFIIFTAASILFKYYEGLAEADLAAMVQHQNLIIPPLDRAENYLFESGTGNAYSFGETLYARSIIFRKESPSYEHIVDCLGWGIDDPYGINGGDNSSTFFQFYIMGLTEYIAYVDGLQEVDPNNSFTEHLTVIEDYFDVVNEEQARMNLMKGTIYFDSYSLGLLGFEKMNQIDSHTFYNNGLSLQILLPDHVYSDILDAEVNFYDYNGGITNGTVNYEIDDTGLNGSFTHQGNGNYTVSIDISSISISQPTIFRFEVAASYGGTIVEGFRYFSILPQISGEVFYIVPDKYNLTNEEFACKAFLDSLYLLQTVSINEFRYSIPNPDSLPVLTIYSNEPSLHSFFADTVFLQKLKEYMMQGANVALFGNAVELLDMSGITTDLFENQTAYYYGIEYQRITNINHPVTQEYTLNYQFNPRTGCTLYGSYFPDLNPSIGMVNLGYFYYYIPYSSHSLKDLGEIPYGNGKAVFLGYAGFLYATDDFLSLAGRIIDHLQNQSNASVKVDMSSPVPGFQNQVFEIAVDVTAYGGVLPIDYVTSKLNIPANTSLEYVTVDGNTVTTDLSVSLGTMNSGDIRHVIYGLYCSTLGIKYFSVNVTTGLVYEAYDELQKSIHLPGALNDNLLLVMINDQENQALHNKLEWMGYSYTTSTVQNIIDNGIGSAYKQVVIFNNASSLPADFQYAGFHNRLKDFMNQGGNLALFGNAVELLDMSGITDNRFSNLYIGDYHHREQHITNIYHPITEEYSSDYVFNYHYSNPTFYGSSFILDLNIGMVKLGHFCRQYGKDIYIYDDNFGEIHYGSGKAVFLGIATFEYEPLYDPNALKHLSLRIIDHLQNQGNSSVKVEMSTPVPGFQNEVFEIAVDVTAYGGVLPIDYVTSKLNVPSNTSLEYVMVDGNTVTTDLSVYLGTMNNGDIKHVIYGLYCSTLGIKDFSVNVTTGLVYEAYDQLQKSIHLPGSLNEDLLVVLINDQENQALHNTLDWMGYSYTTSTVQNIIDNGISSVYKQVVIFNNASSLPADFQYAGFHNRLKDFMNQGGNLALFGNAVELLDMSGITTDLFENHYASYVYWDCQYITNINHPVTQEYTLNYEFKPRTSGTLYGSYFPNLNPSIGMVNLGYYYAYNYGYSNRKDFGEIPYGNGKALFLGCASFLYATDEFFSLSLRIIDHSQNQSNASVKVEMSTTVPGFQNQVFEIAVDVTAYGGVLPIDYVVSTLNIPNNTSLEYVMVDNDTVTTDLAVSLGTMNNGEIKHVVYGLYCSTLGIKDFSVNVTTGLVYEAYDELQKSIHLPGALNENLLVVLINDQENQALHNTLDWMGYSYTTSTVQNIIDNGISNAYKQVVIFNNTSALPADFQYAGFHNRLKDFMNQGGNLALFGNATELLDMSGITTDLFENHYASYVYWDCQYITNINHPVTQEYTLNYEFKPRTSGTLYGSYFPNLNPSIGMVNLGFYWDYQSSPYDFKDLGEIPYGNGKALFLGYAGFLYATDDFLSLAGRIIDYAQFKWVLGFELDLKVFLEGPFDGTEMNTGLNNDGYLPLSQPFNIPPWNYAGSENVTSIPDTNIVDWILIELRETPYNADSATGITKIAQQAGFILKDGKITGIDGISPLHFNDTINNNLYVVIHHRNHLGIMSAYPLIDSAGIYTYDFTTGVEQAYGGANGHKEIGTGIWGMIGGDGDANGQIDDPDKDDVWVLQAGNSGFLSGDFTMESQVNNNDKNDIWLLNEGEGTQTPDNKNREDSQLTWRFANPTIIPGSPQLFQFDIELKCNEQGTYHSQMQIYFDYDTLAFGSNIDGIYQNPDIDERISCSFLELMDPTKYLITNDANNSPGRYAIITQPIDENYPIALNDLTEVDTFYKGFLRFQIEIQDTSQLSGIFFSEWLMDGGQYFIDPDRNTLPVKYFEPCLYENNMNVPLSVNSQNLTINSGWNGISSYLTPGDPDVVNMFSPINSTLLILYNYTGMYWPATGTNTLGNWEEYSGYVIKLSGDDDLTIYGDDVIDKTVNLNTNWNLIPVLSKTNTDVVSLFSGVTGFAIAKDVAGIGVYWPIYNINTMVNLEPCKAYFVRMDLAGSITFPSGGDNAGFEKPVEFVNITPWNDIHHTPGTHVIAFADEAISVLEAGDIIGAFTESGLCAGMTQFSGNSAGLVLNGDDIYTSEIDGFVSDEYISYKLYRSTTGETFDLKVEYDPSLDNSGLFHVNGMSAITDVKMSASSVSENYTGSIRIYPNPTERLINILFEGISKNVIVKIADLRGNEYYHFEITGIKTTITKQLDLSELSAGVYFISFTGEGIRQVKKIVIR